MSARSSADFSVAAESPLVSGFFIPPPTKHSAKKPRAPSSPVLLVLCSPLPPRASGLIVVPHSAIEWWPIVTCDRPAGLECLEPRGLDRRCKTRWADSCCQCPLIERLGVLCYWGWRRANDMWKEQYRKRSEVFVCEVLDVLREITVEDREEAYVVVLKGHKMGDMQRPNSIRPLICPCHATRAPPSSFMAKARRRDLNVQYVSKVLCGVLPVKPAARAAALMS